MGCMKYARITVDPNQMDGVRCIRGLRIPATTIISMLAVGMSNDEILHAYPDLRIEDINEAKLFAADREQRGKLADGEPC
jgi:uncharacterized protein (DUF433 family)